MKLTLLMAVTLNGYIAGSDDDTNWVKDIDSLNQKISEMGAVILGRRTYDECMKYDAFPYENALNVVMTHDQKLLHTSNDQVLFTDNEPDKVLQHLQEKGFDKALLIGGGHLNGSFMKLGLVDEVIIDVHPLIKSDGIRLFEEQFPDVELELLETKTLNDGLVQICYLVK